MVRIEWKQGEEEFAMIASGHAGYAPSGQEDIVCAAVSALIFTMMQTAARLEEKAVRHLTAETKSGYAAIRFAVAERLAADLLCLTIHSGLSMLAERYPDHVCLIDQNKEKGEIEG